MKIRLWMAIAVGVAIMLAEMTTEVWAQCPPGQSCPSGGRNSGVYRWAPSAPIAPDVVTPPKSQRPIPGVCRIAVHRGQEICYGSGVLVWRGSRRAVVLSVQHLFRGRRGRVIVTFPNGEQYEAERIETDTGPDLGAVVIPRPDVEPVPMYGDDPEPGQRVTLCGFGPGGNYRALPGTIQGYVQNATGKAHDLLVTGQARQGDSGGPILNERGEVVGIIWGTDGRTSRGAFNGRVCQFVTTDRYAFPWNAEVEQERIKADAGAYAPPPLPLVPVAPSAPNGPTIDATARQMAQAALDRIAALAKEIEEADAAIAATTEAADHASRIAATAALDAGAAERGITEIEGGLRDRIKERIAGKIKEAGLLGAGGVGLALLLLYFFIKKDIKDRIETGDPLAIEKLAARTPWSFDDKIAGAVADRLQARHESGGVDVGAALAELKGLIAGLKSDK